MWKNENRMSDGKGKGRAKGDEDGDKGQSDEQPSMLSRVAASATGLTRSAFASPTSNELNERAAALADSGKGQIGQSSSSSDNSAWAESPKGSQQNAGQANSASAFRVGHNEEHIRQSENEFSSFLNGIDSFTPSENTEGGHFVSGGLGDDLGEAWTRSQPASSLPPQKPIYGSVSEQQSRDGENVVAILSQNGTMEETFEAPQEDENYDWGLSAEQLSQLRAMTKDLFPSTEAHGITDSDHPLNLAPNFEGAYGQPPTGSDDWREQWDGVLNRYTDEVWGGLLPLVKEARKEVDDLRNHPSSTEQPKALRRLGAILGHLRKY
jgi:hypothetical protein